MRALPILVLAVSTVAGPLCAGALAQVPALPALPSSVIAEIHQTGSSHYADAQVAAACGLKPGDTVTREELQAAADRLAQSGVFSRVNYRFTTRADKLVVEFQLADAPTVPVTFDNFPWFSDEELSAAIRQMVPFFDGSAPQEGALLDTVTSAVSKLLETHGISGSVQHALLAEPASDGMTLQFHLDGPSLTIASLDYGDPLAQSSTKLDERKQDLLNKPFSRFAIETFEFEQIRPLYLSTGNLRVNFAPPVARFAADPNQPLPSNVAVRLPIDPGPVFHFSGVSFDGNRAFEANALSAMSTIKPGELADGIKLEALWQRVENEYAHAGYIHALVEPKPKFDDSGATVSYLVAITEGPQYQMGKLVVTGLSPTAESALRAKWQVASGTIFDAAYADDMFAKLEKPSRAIFGTVPVNYDKMGHFLRPDETTHTVDVLIDFQ